MIQPKKTEGDAFHGLPGAELVTRGLEDLRAGTVSVESLLLQVASPRLERLNILVPEAICGEPPEHALYSLLEQNFGRGAHSQYNALLRRMASFARSLERETKPRPA